MGGKSISELEASRGSFSKHLGSSDYRTHPILTDSESLIAVSAEAITNIVSNTDYCNYFPYLEDTGPGSKLASILENCEGLVIETNISTVLPNLAEFGSLGTVNKVLEAIVFNRMAVLLSLNCEEWHESMFIKLKSLTKAE